MTNDDGGHYTEKHGVEQAVVDADTRVATLNSLMDTFKAMLLGVDSPSYVTPSTSKRQGFLEQIEKLERSLVQEHDPTE